MAPSAFDSSWRCGQHGTTFPLSVFERLDQAVLAHIRGLAEVPLWLPDPMPTGWQLSGLGAVGDRRSRLRATVAACSGPAPLGGVGEWLLISEEPGIGLGAGYAGTDPDTLPAAGVPEKIAVRGHPTPLWPVPGANEDRSVYVGEAAGVWLWLISFPGDAGYAILEDLAVTDVWQRFIPVAEAGSHSQRLRPGTW